MSEMAFGIHRGGHGATVIEYGDEQASFWSGLGMEQGSVTREMVATAFVYMRRVGCRIYFAQTFFELYGKARRRAAVEAE